MKNAMLIVLISLVSFNLFAQKKIEVKNVCCKNDTTMVFSITDKDLSAEFEKINKYFGEPKSCKPGEIIWSDVEVPNIGKGLQIKLVDGILTIKNENIKFRKFSSIKNKNCKLRCLEENQQRQINIIIMDENKKNIINTNALKTASIKYLESIIK
jgi:hypothetical protein